ncbi:MAG: DUF4349 domain-containing protein [Ruminococcaceae bacterium]|nr:DUF4349 domain-containing protein [Oscillospiraceae bacterium]
MKRERRECMKKSALNGAFAILLGLTYLLSMTSCGSDSAVRDNVKFEAMTNGAAADYGYFADAEMEMPMEEVVYDKAMGSTSSSYTSPAAPAGKQPETGQNDLSARKLIKTANLDVETKHFDDFMKTLESNIASSGGYVSSSSVNGSSFDSNRVRYANLTVRVPSDTYDSFVSGVAGYGNVTYQSESVNDVTLAYVDTESRIKAYEAEYETLLDILSKAESLDDVLVIQNRITEVTYQLESYRSQLRTYDDLISYCTVHLSISEVVELTEIKEKPATVGERMARGLKDTLDDIGDDTEDFAVWFVSALPVLVIWAVVIAAAVLIVKGAVRRARRKRYEKVMGKDSREGENEK